MTTLQDIMGLITKRKIKTPSDNDYIISAAYSDTQERLKPQPKMEASLLSIGAIKKFILSSIAPPKYKVFTALLTQSGGDAGGSINFQNLVPLVIGQSYTIVGNLPIDQKGTDFTNVGAPDNNFQTSFIATATTPIWGTEGGELFFNEGAPIATVLENTIGNVWFTYVDLGSYTLNSNGLFGNDALKVPKYENVIVDIDEDAIRYIRSNWEDDSLIEVQSRISGADRGNGLLNNTFIEIRFYN